MSDPSFEIIPVQMVTIGEHTDGQRIDNFLMAQFRSLPKSRIYQMIRKGEVRVNRGRIRPQHRLKTGDLVRLPPVKIPKSITIPIPLADQSHLLQQIVFEDEWILALNKPSGIAVHAGSNIPFGVIEILRAARPELKFLELVHRLDRETSGILLLAKTGQVLRELQTLDIKKRYQMLVKNSWDLPSPYRVSAPLDTDHRLNDERHVIVSSSGKPSETIFTLIKNYRDIAFLEAELITGRTHQIRVHVASLDHPIIGDPRYGNQQINQHYKAKGVDRLLLHAHQLSFELKKKNYTLSAPLPNIINQILVMP